MKKILSVLLVAGAMSQIANAMGPMGDLTHRHFYKDQEWIWQKVQAQAKDASPKSLITQSASVHVWVLPISLTSPLLPSTTSVFPPTKPPMASVFPPSRPPMASVFPPTKPPMASVFPPSRPPMASVFPPTKPQKG